MKLMASRIGEDDEDIAFLLHECDIANVDQALDLVKHLYPRRDPPLREGPLLEGLLKSDTT